MPLKRLLALVALSVAIVAGLTAALDFTAIQIWAAAQQRDIQNTMAGAVRAVRAGDGGALWLLCGLTFAYGLVHAIGPGHGKILIGGAALASRAQLHRLAALTLLSSMGQSLSAVILVACGVGLISFTSAQLIGFTEAALAPASYGAIGLVGVWIAYRGLRSLSRTKPQSHCHHPKDTCGCGHSHGPELEDIQRDMSLREMALLVLSISMRPCTGAIFLLVICWRFDIFWAGVSATLTMGLGTASFNLLVAGAGAGVNKLSTQLGPLQTLGTVLPLLQIIAGLFVVLAAWAMLGPYLW